MTVASADIAQLNLVIKSDQVTNARAELNLLVKASAEAEGAANRASTSYARFGGVLAGFASAASLFSFFKQSLNLAATFELTQTGFRTLIGNAQEADAILHKLERYAAETPFRFQGLADASKFMLALGVNAQDVVPQIRILGDAVAALGGGQDLLNRLILAVGQINAKGRLQAEEMRQLAEAGIPAWKILAEAIGTDVPTAMKRVSQGAVDSQTAVAALLLGMEKRFKGSTEAAAQQTRGLFTTLQDEVSYAMRDIGKAIIEAFKVHDKLRDAIDFVTRYKGLAVDIIRVLAGLPSINDANAESATRWANAIKTVVVFLGTLTAFRFLGLIADFAMMINRAANAAVTFSILNTVVAGLSTTFLAMGLGKWAYDNFKEVQIGAEKAIDVLKRLGATMEWVWDSLKATGPAVVKDLVSVGPFRETIGAGNANAIMMMLQNAEVAARIKPKTSATQQYEDTLNRLDAEKKLVLDQIDKDFGDRTSKGISFFDTLGAAGARAFDGITARMALLGKSAAEAGPKVENAVPKDTSELDAYLKKLEEMVAGYDKTGKASEKAKETIERLMEQIDVEITLLDKANATRERSHDVVRLMIAAEAAYGNDLAKQAAIVDEYTAKLRRLKAEREKIAALESVENKIRDFGIETRAILLSTGVNGLEPEVAQMVASLEHYFGEGSATVIKFREQAEKEFAKLKKSKELKELGDAIGDAVGRGVEQAIFEAKTLKEVLSSTLKEIMQLIFHQMVTKQIAQMVSGGLTGVFGKLFGSATGNVFSGGTIVPFAGGGVFDSPTFFPMRGGNVGLLGEAGPESIMPLKRMPNGRLGVESSGGQSRTYNTYVTIKTNDASSFKRSSRQVGRDLTRAMRGL